MHVVWVECIKLIVLVRGAALRSHSRWTRASGACMSLLLVGEHTVH